MEKYIDQTNVDNRIHVALSPWDLTDGYNQHAGVTIASFLDNCNGENAAVHLLYDEKLNKKNPKGVEDNKKKYAELCDKFGADLYYHHVELPEWVNELESVKRWTPGTLMRLYLPELLPEVSKILYLDCDMVVNTDVRVIWRTSLHNVPLAAVPDSDSSNISKKRMKRLLSLDVDPRKYFCAGTLLLNLDYLRQTMNLSNDSLNILQKHPDLPFLDQDILNILFSKLYIPLPVNYNRYVVETTSTDNAILHYAGPAKPWGAYHGLQDLPYWHYVLQTPWGDDTEKILHSALSRLNFEYMGPTFISDFKYAPAYLPFMKRMIVALFYFTKKRVKDFRRFHI